MPLKVTATAAAGELHPNPFIGPINHTASIRVDVSALTNKEVDAYGWLKPGVPLTRTGILVGAAPAFVYGCVAEAVRVHTDNTTLAGVTNDIDVAVATIGQINRKILEDSLTRVLTANELAGFDAAGSRMVLQF